MKQIHEYIQDRGISKVFEHDGKYYAIELEEDGSIHKFFNAEKLKNGNYKLDLDNGVKSKMAEAIEKIHIYGYKEVK